jgi:hypothetical protein
MNAKIAKHAASFIMMAIWGFLAVGSADTDTDTQKTAAQIPTYSVSAIDLLAEYDANEVAADVKYKDHVVIVSGEIVNIGMDVLDQAYIVIGGTGFLDGVQCLFTEAQKSTVASLRKGQRVRVKGEVSGKMGNVILGKCTLH